MVALTSSQLPLAQAAAARALSFTEQQEATLPAALIRYLWFNGDAAGVVSALAPYQNPDGGFGNRLEPDIRHPSSNAFAARIAMQYLLELPADSGVEMKANLQTWLDTNQHEDGDWHFSEESRSGFMQPWFAAWQHPGLNPACCVAGHAAALGIASNIVLWRVATLFDRLASHQEAENGDFYTLLPYVEYTRGVEVPNAKFWYPLLANRIVGMLETDKLDDAEHFFTLALGGSPEITRRIPDEVMSAQIDELLAEQQEDGGWPTPYDESWRVWTTASNIATLARSRWGILRTSQGVLRGTMSR